MINHFFNTLYNLPAATSSGIYVDLAAPLRVPDAVTAALNGFRGSSREAAESFALQALKVVEGSTYRAEIRAEDSRLSYHCNEVGVDMPDSSSFLAMLANAPGSLQILITSQYSDLKATISTSQVLQDKAAAIVVGIVRLITKENQP